MLWATTKASSTHQCRSLGKSTPNRRGVRSASAAREAGSVGAPPLRERKYELSRICRTRLPAFARFPVIRLPGSIGLSYSPLASSLARQVQKREQVRCFDSELAGQRPSLGCASPEPSPVPPVTIRSGAVSAHPERVRRGDTAQRPHAPHGAQDPIQLGESNEIRHQK